MSNEKLPNAEALRSRGWNPHVGRAITTSMSCRSWSWVLAFVGATLLVACSNDVSEDEPAFDYGGDEMKAAIEGTWEGTSKPDAAGAGSPVTLKLTYATPDTRPLCGNRVLASGESLTSGIAPRCIDMSSINVTGTLTSRPAATEAPRDMPVRGTFLVASLRFTGHGDLEAEVDGGRLSATLSNDVLEGDLQGQDGAVIAAFTLRRTK